VSRTEINKGNEPDAKGVPVIIAVLVLKDNPAGSEPVTDQVNGAAPPDALSVAE